MRYRVHSLKVMEGVRGLCTTTESLMKEADTVVNSRSRDLQTVVSLLHDEPVSTRSYVWRSYLTCGSWPALDNSLGPFSGD